MGANGAREDARTALFNERALEDEFERERLNAGMSYNLLATLNKRL